MKKISLLVSMLVLLASVGAAQEQPKKPGPGIAEWLKALHQKIALILPAKSIPVTNGVAGVRGAKQDAQVKLYWKGKKGEDAVSEEEMNSFKAAIEAASTPDRAAAAREIEKFMAVYPDSALIPDAKKTLDLVKAEPAEEKKAEEKKEGAKRTEQTEEKK